MNTAISVTGSGAWEDATTPTTLVPIPPGETGTGQPGDDGSPVPVTGRAVRSCAGIARPAVAARGARPPLPAPSGAPVGAPGRRRAAVRIAPAHTPARRGPAVAPAPAELVERARAGFAATALTAVITAAVVTGFLALAHLRAPDPQPAPVPTGIPAVAVPPGAGPGAGIR
ncbi:hypothetical protein [Nocardia carnea]|uniref:hypothetical protein n=1 Tax=Nocardia carnea TaxID=37328 RepID=UPI002457532D|nr:hypothetical protein [Nocardia carnea]